MEEVLARPASHGNRHGVIVLTQEIGHLSAATKQALIGDDLNHNAGTKLFHCGMWIKVGAVARNHPD